MYTMRTSKPSAGNKFFITRGNGGYSYCIEGYPRDRECNVLSNCVGYACGRFNEIIGSMKYPYLNCNAEDFIDRARSLGLKISNKPVRGGIMVWRNGQTHNGYDGAGHVAIVEKIIDNNRIYTSESNYGNTAFYNATRTNSNGQWGVGRNYIFIGCIINPYVKDNEPEPTPTPNKDIETLAREVLRGEWGNGQDRVNRLTQAGYDYNKVQARVEEILAREKTNEEELLKLVKMTIRGDFGNGEARRQALGNKYDEVQRQVNINIANGLTNWNNIKLF